MIKKLTKIDPLSCGKVLAVVYFGISLLFIPFFLLGMLMGSQMPHQPGAPNPMAMMAGSGLIFVIIMPILYTLIGFIGGIIMAFIYNLAAKFTGGLEMTFTDAPAKLISGYPGSLPPR